MSFGLLFPTFNQIGPAQLNFLVWGDKIEVFKRLKMRERILWRIYKCSNFHQSFSSIQDSICAFRFLHKIPIWRSWCSRCRCCCCCCCCCCYQPLLLLLWPLLYIHCQLRCDAKRVVVVWMLLTTVILLFRMPRCYEQQLLLVLLLAAFMLLLSTAIFVLKLLVVSLTVDCLCKFMVLFTCSR